MRHELSLLSEGGTSNVRIKLKEATQINCSSQERPKKVHSELTRVMAGSGCETIDSCGARCRGRPAVVGGLAQGGRHLAALLSLPGDGRVQEG